MVFRMLRLIVLAGGLTWIVASSQSVALAAFCCDTGDAWENEYYNECPDGPTQDDRCAHLYSMFNFCWTGCNFQSCGTGGMSSCDSDPCFPYACINDGGGTFHCSPV